MTIRVWDIPRLTCLRVFHEEQDVLDVAVCGRTVAAFTNDDVVVVWDADSGACVMRLELRMADVVEDPGILTREVKIQLSKWHVVCGFENTWFITMCRVKKAAVHCLFQTFVPHPNEATDSSSYPTVLSIYDDLLSPEEEEVTSPIPSTVSPISTLGLDVITDFNMEPTLAGPHLLATVEDQNGEVYVVQWDFRAMKKSVCGGGNGERGYRFGGRERGLEKRRLEDEGGTLVFEYANYYLCYEI
ncbi:hypothetical protein BC829DRAFT_399931 [Chytridium lagenaria]|nr:hypothetical protein BC829DRAFT_399931 [Chytridium lagenaria]